MQTRSAVKGDQDVEVRYLEDSEYEAQDEEYDTDHSRYNSSGASDSSSENELPDTVDNSINTRTEKPIRAKGDRTRDNQGYIRVAKRKNDSNLIHATWGPREGLRARLFKITRNEISSECQKDLGKPGLLFYAEKEHQQYIKESSEYLLTFFNQVGNQDRLMAFCDWTGLPLRVDPGLFCFSLEAAYNCANLFPNNNSHIVANHAKNNLFLSFSCINFAKRYMAPVVLPLLGQWLRTWHDQRDFKAKEPELRWLFYALINCIVIHVLCGISIQQRAERLGKLQQIIHNDDMQFQELLEVLRTGTWSSLVEKLLSQWKLQLPNQFRSRVFQPYDKCPTQEHRRFDHRPHDELYGILLQIARNYGISQAEFDMYLTIPSVNHHGKRVFYPFHKWSVPFAQLIFWDCDTTLGWAKARIAMLKKCDRAAVALDVNEENLTPERFLCEIAHQQCGKLQQLKAKTPKSDSDKLHFAVGLDLMGFPLVPFVNHPTKATIAKYPQHGIAMETGYQGAADDEDFDYVASWNPGRSTMQFTTTLSNHGQGEYDVDVTRDVSASIQSIPWDGALAAPCDTLGSKIWGVELRLGEVRCPPPQFACSALLPVKPWINGEAHDFSCPVCNMPQLSVGSRTHHMVNNHYLGTTFDCGLCSEKFLSSETCRFHKEYEHPKSIEAYSRNVKDYWDRFVCLYKDCDLHGSYFSDIRHSESHKRAVHLGEKPFICDVCQVAFSHKNNLEQHKRAVHLGEKLFICDVCQVAFSQKSHLEQHKRAVHLGKKPFICNICQVAFSRNSDLGQHKQAVHLGKKPFICNVCQVAFSHKSHLEQHKRAVHLGEKPFICDVCQVAFSHKNNLEQHKRAVHLGEKPFICNVCQAAFSQKSHLKQHKRAVHLGEKPFICNICQVAFSRNSHLEQHKRAVHLGEKPFICNVCQVAFSQKSDLEQHKRAVHLGEKPFICDVCQVAFSQKSDLERHKRAVHLGEKPFICDVCQAAFAEKSKLKRHKQAKHPGGQPANLAKRRKLDTGIEPESRIRELDSGSEFLTHKQPPLIQQEPKISSANPTAGLSPATKPILPDLGKPSRARHLRALVNEAEWRACDKIEQIGSYWNLEATSAAIQSFPCARFQRLWTSGDGLSRGLRSVIQSLERQFPGGGVPIPRQEVLRSAIRTVQRELGITDTNEFTPEVLQGGLQTWADQKALSIRYRVGIIYQTEEGTNKAWLPQVQGQRDPVQAQEVVVWVYLRRSQEYGYYEAIAKPDVD